MMNQVQQTVESKELTAKILLKTFETEDTHETREYVSIELPDPFGDEDFVDIAIMPKWKNDAAVFKFYAKKALRTEPELAFPVTLKVLSYNNRKKKKTVWYAGLVGTSPFSGSELEFVVKSEDNRAVFTELANKLLGLEPLWSDEDGDI